MHWDHSPSNTCISLLKAYQEVRHSIYLKNVKRVINEVKYCFTVSSDVWRSLVMFRPCSEDKELPGNGCTHSNVLVEELYINKHMWILELNSRTVIVAHDTVLSIFLQSIIWYISYFHCTSISWKCHAYMKLTIWLETHTHEIYNSSSIIFQTV